MTEMFTRTAESGVTSTVTPLRGSTAPKVSCTRLMKPPFMPMTPGTSRIAMATIFSITPLLKVSESSLSRSSSSTVTASSAGVSAGASEDVS